MRKLCCGKPNKSIAIRTVNAHRYARCTCLKCVRLCVRACEHGVNTRARPFDPHAIHLKSERPAHARTHNYAPKRRKVFPLCSHCLAGGVCWIYGITSEICCRCRVDMRRRLCCYRSMLLSCVRNAHFVSYACTWKCREAKHSNVGTPYTFGLHSVLFEHTITYAYVKCA